jgi:hypothetical protein
MKYNPVIVSAFWRSQKLPVALPEFSFHPVRKWRFDWAFLDAMVYVECDGGIWIQGGHNRGAQMQKDWEKRNAATILGWRGLWVQPKDICTVEFAEIIQAAINFTR